MNSAPRSRHWDNSTMAKIDKSHGSWPNVLPFHFSELIKPDCIHINMYHSHINILSTLQYYPAKQPFLHSNLRRLSGTTAYVLNQNSLSRKPFKMSRSIMSIRWARDDCWLDLVSSYRTLHPDRRKKRMFCRLSKYRLFKNVKNVPIYNTYKSIITKGRMRTKDTPLFILATSFSFFAVPAARHGRVLAACCRGRRGPRKWPWQLP